MLHYYCFKIYWYSLQEIFVYRLVINLRFNVSLDCARSACILSVAKKKKKKKKYIKACREGKRKSVEEQLVAAQPRTIIRHYLVFVARERVYA